MYGEKPTGSDDMGKMINAFHELKKNVYEETDINENNNVAKSLLKGLLIDV